jgi:hypothetical protein
VPVRQTFLLPREIRLPFPFDLAVPTALSCESGQECKTRSPVP